MLAEFQLGPISIEDPKILIAQILGFVIFAAIVWIMPKTIPLGVPFLKDATNERNTRIENSLTLVETAVSDTQRIHDDYANRLRSVEAEANKRIEAAVREAEIVRNDIISDAQTTAEQMRQRAEQEIARETIRQRIILRRQIVQITLDAAEQSVKAMNSEKTQRALIQDFIARAANDNGVSAPAPAVTAFAPMSTSARAPVLEPVSAPAFEAPAPAFETPAAVPSFEAPTPTFETPAVETPAPSFEPTATTPPVFETPTTTGLTEGE